MREEIGDAMHNLKKAAAVALMVGGIGLGGSGVASAHGAVGDPYVDNRQVVECDQEFDGGTATTGSITVPVTGDVEQHIGNFCTVVGGDVDD